MEYKNLTCSQEGSVLHIYVNRPEVLNALNRDTLDELSKVVKEVHHEKGIHAAIITGTGKAFAAGADIKELAHLNREQALAFARQGQGVFRQIEESPKPFVAAINGFALGGGLEMAMACHLRVASAEARMGQPESNLGLIPGYGATQRLTQLVGKAKALELMLTAEKITAPEALAIGLVNHVVATVQELLPFTVSLLDKVITRGPIAIAKIIETVNAGFSFEEKGYKTELENFAFCAATEDFKEGTDAFMNKRAPVFKGV